MHIPDPTVCQSELRRHKVRQEGYNGFDYLEVNLEKSTLTVYLLAKLIDPEKITARNFVIYGGRRVRDVRILKVQTCRPPDPRIDDCLILTFNKPGDYSTYTLCIVDLDEDGHPLDKPYSGFDRRYACLDFSFAVDCPSDLDCQVAEVCPPEPQQEPEINYLAKDYASFRRLILDRLALSMPDWQERHVPDLGVTLVELLAYTGDYLSYYQDAVATEAYLDTARQRISVRRHARLVDYHMHEGSNARAWLCLCVDQPEVELDPADITFLTRLEGYPTVVSYFDEIEDLSPAGFETFAPLLPGGESPEAGYQVRPYQQGWISEAVEARPKIVLRKAHNHLRFYTWGDEECCLPVGSCEAWLVDDGAQLKTPPAEKPPYDGQEQNGKKRPAAKPKPSAAQPVQKLGPGDFDWSVQLQSGDFLIFEEVLGPKTGIPSDANPAHRHVVRLTSVERDVDRLYQVAVLHITWATEDRLPFPLCICAPAHPPDCESLCDVSVACANVILVDHGRPVPGEDLGCVPGDCLPAECVCGRPGDISYRPGRFRPRLSKGPLVFGQPLPPEPAAAAELIKQDPRKAIPVLSLLAFPDSKCRPHAPSDQEDPGQSPQEDPSGQNDPKQQPNAGKNSPGQEAQKDPDTPEQEPLPAERWLPQYDLLDSSAASQHFVVEMDSERQAHLRFGDGYSGKQPAAYLRFLADYRTGGGPNGNVGAETITHLAYRNQRPAGISLVRNPMPSTGGTAPEPVSQVKLFAPQAFRTQMERAVLAEDYAAIVMRDFADKVQRAWAELRWTGSGYEVLLAIDVLGAEQPAEDLLVAIREHLCLYRRIGHDLRVQPARQVGLVIEMEVCVAPEFLKGHVEGALLDEFSNRRLPGGRMGFFHPDRLTLGQDIYLSELVTAAQQIPGVLSATVTGLRRYGEPHDPTGDKPDEAVISGVLPLGSLEVAHLDNDPGQPENGRLFLTMEGGR